MEKIVLPLVQRINSQYDKGNILIPHITSRHYTLYLIFYAWNDALRPGTLLPFHRQSAQIQRYQDAT